MNAVEGAESLLALILSGEFGSLVGEDFVGITYKDKDYTGKALHAAFYDSIGPEDCHRLVQGLLAARADPSAQATSSDEKLRVQALHMATYSGHSRIVADLLTAKAEVDVPELVLDGGTPTGHNTPLHIATWYLDCYWVGSTLTFWEIKGFGGFQPLNPQKAKLFAEGSTATKVRKGRRGSGAHTSQG